MTRGMRLLGPVTGVLAAVALGVGMSTGTVDIDPTEGPGQAMARFREAGGDLETGVFLAVLGAGLLVLFLASLRSNLRDRGAGWLADGMFAGGILLTVALLVDLGARLLGKVAAEHGHAQIALTAVDFGWESAWLATPGILAFGACAMLASFTARALPIWLGVFAVVLTLTALAPWMGVGGFVFWVLGAAIAELVTAIRTPAGAPAPVTS